MTSPIFIPPLNRVFRKLRSGFAQPGRFRSVLAAVGGDVNLCRRASVRVGGKSGNMINGTADGGAMITESTITCPHCKTAKTEAMPTDACQYFYECSGCGMLLRPKQGDCCVFCSYGSAPCPPIQAARSAGCCD